MRFVFRNCECRFDEYLMLMMFSTSVQALRKSVVGVSPFCDVLVDSCSSVGLCLFGVCMLKDASFLFPYVSFLFPYANCLFSYANCLFSYVSFLFTYASSVIR